MPANIFSLSTPQFLKFKPHHLLQFRGLGKAIPWVECFPTINLELPPQPFLKELFQSLLHFSVVQRPLFRMNKGLGEGLS